MLLVKCDFSVAHILVLEHWFRSSGQRARILVRRSKFETSWSLHFSVKCCFSKNEENKRKRRATHVLIHKWVSLILIYDKGLIKSCAFVCANHRLTMGRASPAKSLGSLSVDLINEFLIPSKTGPNFESRDGSLSRWKRRQLRPPPPPARITLFINFQFPKCPF